MKFRILCLSLAITTTFSALAGVSVVESKDLSRSKLVGRATASRNPAGAPGQTRLNYLNDQGIKSSYFTPATTLQWSFSNRVLTFSTTSAPFYSVSIPIPAKSAYYNALYLTVTGNAEAKARFVPGTARGGQALMLDDPAAAMRFGTVTFTGTGKVTLHQLKK